MKGLIIKDIMCLKKQLTIFVYVLISDLIVSVMYVLSARFGNISAAGKVMLAENQMSGIDIKNLASMALVFFMLLPPATVCDMVNVFQADGKAGFYKIAGALPVSLKKRVLSKYLTIYTLFLIGGAVDILMAALLAGLTDLITFKDFFNIIVSCVSVMSIYSSLVILYCIVIGYGKEMYAQLLSIGTMLLAVILVNWNTLRKIMTAIITDDIGDAVHIWRILDFIKEKSWILFIIAILTSVLSYVLTTVTAERKRGVI